MKYDNLMKYDNEQRHPSVRSPQCLTHTEEGFQFCHKCGAGIQMDDSAMSRLQKKLQELLGSSYYVTKKKSRGQKDRKATMATAPRESKRCHEALQCEMGMKSYILADGTRPDVSILIASEPLIFPTTRHAHSANVTQRCGDSRSASTNFQLGPTRIKK